MYDIRYTMSDIHRNNVRCRMRDVVCSVNPIFQMLGSFGTTPSSSRKTKRTILQRISPSIFAQLVKVIYITVHGYLLILCNSDFPLKENVLCT